MSRGSNQDHSQLRPVRRNLVQRVFFLFSTGGIVAEVVRAVVGKDELLGNLRSQKSSSLPKVLGVALRSAGCNKEVRPPLSDSLPAHIGSHNGVALFETLTLFNKMGISISHSHLLHVLKDMTVRWQIMVQPILRQGLSIILTADNSDFNVHHPRQGKPVVPLGLHRGRVIGNGLDDSRPQNSPHNFSVRDFYHSDAEMAQMRSYSFPLQKEFLLLLFRPRF